MKKEAMDFPRNPHFCFRLSIEERERFKAAARAEKKALGTWIRWLARQRIEWMEMNGLLEPEKKQ